MSASPTIGAAASTKRPLEDESSPAGPNDQPEAKRPALDKHVSQDISPNETEVKNENENENTSETKLENSAPIANGHVEAKEEEASVAVFTSAIPSITETQPIQSTAGQHDQNSRAGSVQHHTHQDETGWLHVRAVISSAEAATVIGKGGENVSQIRRLSGSKCTVSDYSRGAVERILTVSGLVDAVAKVSRN